MKVLIYGLNYAPEQVGVGKYTGETATWLAQRGHDIEVICAAPHYPEWRIAPGYSGARYARSTEGGVRVLHCPLWLPTRYSPFKRVLTCLSFVLTSLAPLLRSLWRRPDVLLVIEPTFLCVPPAWLFGKMLGVPIWLHVQDFELAAAHGLGYVGTRGARFTAAVEGWFLRRLDHVSTLNATMLAQLERFGVDASRRGLFPNWVDCEHIHPLPRESAFRAELGLKPGEIVVLYSGSFGRKHGLEIVIEAARVLQKEHAGIRWVLCGEGIVKPALVKSASRLSCVQFLPLQPRARLNELLNLADIHVLPQRAGVAHAVLPSKLTGMLASGRPVIATAEAGTEIATVLQGAGLVVKPGDAEALAQVVALLAADPQRRKELGEQARRLALTNFDRQRILERFEESIEEIA